MINQVTKLVQSFITYENKVLVGKVGYKWLAISNKRVVQIPYFAPRTKTVDPQKWNALGIAVTELINKNHPSLVFAVSNPLFWSQEIKTGAGLENKSQRLRSKDNGMQPLLFSDRKFENSKGTHLAPSFRSRRDRKEVRDHHEDIYKPAKVEMRLIKVQYPYLDSTILSQYLAANRNKYNFTRMHKALFKKVPLLTKDVRTGAGAGDHRSPAHDEVINNELLGNSGSLRITGIKLELSGRLTTQRSIPRKTVSNKHVGSFRTTINKQTSFVSEIRTDLNQYASKNKLGAYTIKVWLSTV